MRPQPPMRGGGRCPLSRHSLGATAQLTNPIQLSKNRCGGRKRPLPPILTHAAPLSRNIYTIN